MSNVNTSEFLRLVGLPETWEIRSEEKYLCVCLICRTEKNVLGRHLSKNIVKSCGCLQKNRAPRIDLTGESISGALVFGYVGRSKWRCYHEGCGHWSDIDGDSLKRYETDRFLCTSCCRSKLTTERNTSHGRSSISDSTYSTWLNMRRRCASEDNNRYHRYGGRGIRVCEAWDNSFESFLEDMGERGEGMTIDRIDNDEDYCKENCRWVDMYEQAKSKSSNYLIRINGVDNTLRAWCESLGLKYKNIFYHFKYGGKPLEKLLGVEKVEFINMPTITEKS